MAALLGLTLSDQGTAASPAVSTQAQSVPSLPGKPGEIGTLRRGPDGSIIHVAPDRPTPVQPVKPLPAPVQGLQRPPAERPPDTSPLPGFSPPSDSPTPSLSAPVFDPRRLESLQDQALHRHRAASHQSDIDRILREEKQAKEKGATVDARGLTVREIILEKELVRIDRDVRDHETEHYSAGLPYAQLPEFWLVTGPLGRQYAVSGITRFDISEIVGNPDETIRKYEHLRRAALAPRVPSERDREIARELTQQIELLRRNSSASKKRQNGPVR